MGQDGDEMIPQLVCQSCRSSRVKCRGNGYPCDRCLRLCLNCTPAPNDSNSPPPTTLHLCLLYNDLQPLQEEFLEVFAKMNGSDLLDQIKLMRFMNLWRAVSLASGPNLSWDLVAALGPFLTSPIDGLGLGGLPPVLATAPTAVGARHAHLRADTAATSLRLRQSASFKHLDDGCTALLVQTLDDEGHLGYATNVVFDQSFFNMAEMQCGVQKAEHFSFPLFLFASFLAPSDRSHWFRGIMEGFFRTDGRHSYCTIIKAVDRRGDIRLHIVKISQLRFGPPDVRSGEPQQQQQQQQQQHGLFLRFEPVPPSRHITHKPETFYNAKRFIRPKLPEKSFGRRDTPTPPANEAPVVGSISSSALLSSLQRCILPSISTLPHMLGPRGEKTIDFSESHLAEVFNSNLTPSQQAVLESDRTTKEEEDSLPKPPRRSHRMAAKVRETRGGEAKREEAEGGEHDDAEVASLTTRGPAPALTRSNIEGGGGSGSGEADTSMGGGGAPAYPPPTSFSPRNNTPDSWPSWLRDAEMPEGEVPVVTYAMAWTMFENETVEATEERKGEEE